MFAFGQFVLDPVGRMLRKGEERIRVSGKPFEVLVLLVTERGSVVSRDRLRQEIWQSVNVTDGTIDQAMHRLRTVLGDNADEPIYIETVSGGGYRFIAPVAAVREGRGLSVTRRGWWGLATAGAAALGGGLYAWRPGRRRPASWRVDENALSVLDEDGVELWRHNFPEIVYPNFYTNPQKACAFADLDRDGRLEMIFLYRPVREDVVQPKMICFDARGRIQWEFAPAGSVGDFHAHEWGPPYYPNSFAIVAPDAGPVRVMVSSNHHWSFPDHLAVLSSTGKVEGEYWHRGHLTHMAVSRFGDRTHTRVLIGGVNDAPEHRCATMLVFDAADVNGGSSGPNGEPYFRDLKTGTEELEIFFPKTALAEHEEFNQVTSLTLASGRITVIVTEGILTNNPNIVVYEFDSNFNVLSAALGDYAMARYRDLEAEGKIPMDSHVGEAERLKGEVKIRRRGKLSDDSPHFS